MNYQLFTVINGRAGRLDGLDDVMEFAAQRLIYVVFLASAVVLASMAWRRQWRGVLSVGAALVLGFGAALVVSRLSGEVRPFQTHRVHQLIAHEPGASMPSDHATAAFTLAAAVGVFAHRVWGLLLAVAAVLIGVARVWVGVHYPGDIVAGAAIATLAVSAVWVVARARNHRPVAGGSAA
jgi:undecaprenyl-diphosphatase